MLLTCLSSIPQKIHVITLTLNPCNNCLSPQYSSLEKRWKEKHIDHSKTADEHAKQYHRLERKCSFISWCAIAYLSLYELSACWIGPPIPIYGVSCPEYFMTLHMQIEASEDSWIFIDFSCPQIMSAEQYAILIGTNTQEIWPQYWENSIEYVSLFTWIGCMGVDSVTSCF